MHRLVTTTAAVLALAAIPALFATSTPARARDHGDRGLDHAISVAKDRAQAARERLQDAVAKDHDDIARDRARFDRAEDHVDHLQKEDHDHGHK